MLLTSLYFFVDKGADQRLEQTFRHCYPAQCSGPALCRSRLGNLVDTFGVARLDRLKVHERSAPLLSLTESHNLHP